MDKPEKTDISAKRHIDCAWLVSERGNLICCDIRSPLHGKVMDQEECTKEACDFFHEKKEPNQQQRDI